MVRLSFALFAIAGLASASASASHDARSAAHKKMAKVRSASPESLPAPVDDAPSNSTELVGDSSNGHDWKRDLQRFTYYQTGLCVKCFRLTNVSLLPAHCHSSLSVRILTTPLPSWMLEALVDLGTAILTM